MWTVLACTDGLDGWLARRDGTTRSGAFLDPLADKFLVVGGFLALAVRGDFGLVPVVLVVGRRGISLPARQLGKWKTFIQLCAVGAVLMPPTADVTWLKLTILWVAVTLTVVSALDIVFRGWQEARA
jgi:phosphatidylglycerophosphate synthase